MDVYVKDPVFVQSLVLNKKQNSHLAAVWLLVIVGKKTFTRVTPIHPGPYQLNLLACF